MATKADLKSVLYSGIMLLVMFVAADQVAGYLLEELFLKQKKGEYHEISYALKQVNEDVLIFGSSRAVRHYDPAVLADSLQMSAFNVGKLGNTLLYSDAVFAQVLTFHKPKMVILDISPVEFAKTERERGQKSMVNALLKFDHLPAIEERIQAVSPKELIMSKLFRTYKFNSAVYTLLTNDSGKSDLDAAKGFQARKGVKVTDHIVNERNSNYEEDPLLVKTFHNFLENAKKNNIQVHVVISPTTLKQTNTSVERIKAITQAHGFNFIDVSFRPEFRNVSYYYDQTHLNATGAKMFSEMLGRHLNLDRKLLAGKS
jgi:hypothetical protein